MKPKIFALIGMLVILLAVGIFISCQDETPTQPQQQESAAQQQKPAAQPSARAPSQESQAATAAQTPAPKTTEETTATASSTTDQTTIITSAATLKSDKSDYQPGETARLTGAGFESEEKVTLQVVHADDTPATGDDHDPWTVTADGDGNFVTTWHVCEDDCPGSLLKATADGQSSGLHAEVEFMDDPPQPCADGPGDPSDNGVQPECVADNPDCKNLDGCPGNQLKVDPPTSGNYTSADNVLEVEVTFSDGGKSVSWSSNIPVQCVIVKGGNDANVYHYDPASTGDSGLHSPLGAGRDNDEPFGISHVNFCYEKPTCPECEITCPDDITIECDESTDPENTGEATSNCETITFEDEVTQGNCPQEKTIKRTWKAENDCGNSATCVQIITVQDTKAPEITCPADVTIECDESTDPSNTGEATATDNCDESPTVTFKDAVKEGDCPQEKTITRTWKAKDDCGNKSTCVQIITVQDTEAPKITCPADKTVECDESTDPSNTGSATATDNCDTTPTVTFEDEVDEGGCPQEKTITRTWKAEDDCGNSATCVQIIKVEDTKAPEIECPDDIEVCLETINGTVVNYTTPTATDNCDPNPTESCTPPSGSTFPLGMTTVTCTATDACGNEGKCTFKVTVKGGKICGSKFYDADLDGQKGGGESGISGWKIKLNGTDNGGNAVSKTVFTNGSGNYCFNDVPLGNYTISEVAPNASWVATTATSHNVSLTQCDDPVNVDPFGNVCLGAGGGKTLGFWSNKNGQNQMNDGGTSAPELALLSGLCLRDASGNNFDPATYSTFRSWLLSATATNMAYMLSAQLAAMELNVEASFVSGGSLVYAPGCGNTGPGNNFISINDLMATANAALCADGYTPSGDPNRATQECLKNALDKANNNLNFVQSSPCPFNSPY